MVGRNAPPLNLSFFGPAFIYNHFLDLHWGNKDHALTRCSKAFRDGAICSEPMQSGESKVNFCKNSCCVGAKVSLPGRGSGEALWDRICRNSKGALSHVSAQISKLFPAPSIHTSELSLSALKSFGGMYVFVLPEWKIVQNISMGKSHSLLASPGHFVPQCGAKFTGCNPKIQAATHVRLCLRAW